MFSFKQGSFVGLDIQADEIRLVKIKRNTGKIKSFALNHVPSGTIVDGKIIKSSILIDQLKILIHQTKSHGLPCAIALPAPLVLTHRLKLPAGFNKQDYANEIKNNLPRYFPEGDLLSFDFVIEKNNKSYCDVLVVAAPVTLLKEYVTVVTEAGLKIDIIEVDEYALHRAMKGNAGVPQHFLRSFGLALRGHGA